MERKTIDKPKVQSVFKYSIRYDFRMLIKRVKEGNDKEAHRYYCMIIENIHLQYELNLITIEAKSKLENIAVNWYVAKRPNF